MKKLNENFKIINSIKTKMNINIQLQSSSVFHLPLQNYKEDFTFIVNKEIFHTSVIFADLLSPKISKLHQIDPTITEYYINTKNTGNFNTIISLITFQTKTIPENDIPFISEIFDILEISPTDIKIDKPNKQHQKDDNWYHNLQKYLEFGIFFKDEVEEEIERISSNFYEMEDEEKNQIKTLPKDIIESIISHRQLRLESEDELIDLINELYQKDREFFELYSYVYFKNVSSSKMKEFINIFSIEDMSEEIWQTISSRLCEEIKEETKETTRYKKKIY